MIRSLLKQRLKWYLHGVLLFCFIIFSNFQCRKSGYDQKSYRGRLEVKAPCGHYVVSLLKGKMNHLMIEPEWTDPNTGKIFHKVFTVANSCSFPAEMKEGEEFTFTLGGKPQNCMVCMIFYPTPEKKLMIHVENYQNAKTDSLK
jgi:hypothetical protein